MVKYISMMVLSLLFLANPLFGQDKVMAMIEFASGDDVIVIRSGRRLSFRDPIGLNLLEGDQVQTGRGVFLEIRLAAGGAVIKLADNTTFILERIAGGSASLQLVYGRIRAKVEKLAGTDSFSVRSSMAVAGVRGTDFGMDVIMSKVSSQPANLTKTYVFEGAVQVTALVRSGTLAAEGLEPIPREYRLGPGEMLTVTSIEAATDARKTTIEANIDTFWKNNDFSSQDSSLQSSASSDSGVVDTATPGQNLTANDRTTADDAVVDARLIDAARSEGYSRGWDLGYQAGFQAQPVIETPPGMLSIQESRRISMLASLQKGALVSGSLIVATAVVIADYGFRNVWNDNADKGLEFLRFSILLSASALPFLVAGMTIRY